MPGYHEIRRALGGDDGPPWFVIHNGAQIRAVCVRQDLNPKIDADPREVWVGAQEDLPIWGDRLAHDTGPIPLFVSEGEAMGYSQRGAEEDTFEVIGNNTEPHALEAAAKSHLLKPLSRIVYLRLHRA
jgi:hypothetical protein